MLMKCLTIGWLKSLILLSLLVVWPSYSTCCPRKRDNKKHERSFDKFKYLLGNRESSGRYTAKNTQGYLGKYQFGTLALRDLGYKDSKGRWTGKHRVDTEQYFISTPEVQEVAIEEYIEIQKKYLKRKGVYKFIGTSFKGIEVTESGLVAAAHLIGAGGISQMLVTGKIIKDGYGTPATEYLSIFKNIDLDDKGEGSMDKLNRLQELRDKLQRPKESSSGFEDGGMKDLLTDMGLPEGELRDNYVTTDPISESLDVPEPSIEEKVSEKPSVKKQPETSPIKDVVTDSNVKDSEEVIREDQPSKETFEQEYRRLMGASEKEKRTAEWATAATHIASMIDKYTAVPKGINPINFEAHVPSDQIDKLVQLKKFTARGGGKSGYSRDPKSEASERQRRINEKLGIPTSDDMAEEDIVKMRNAMIRSSDSRDRQRHTTDRFDRNLEYKKEEKNELSDKQVEKMSDYKDAIRIFEDVEKLKTGQVTGKEIDTGLLSSISSSVKDELGVEDVDRARLKQLVSNALANKIRSLSGTAASDPERKFLATTLPSIKDNDEQFIAKLNQAKLDITRAMELRAKTIGKTQGKDISGLELPSEDAKKSDYTPEIETKIQRVMKANPSASREAIIKALKEKGKL